MKDGLLSTDAEFLLRCAGMEPSEHDQVVRYVLEAALAPAEASRLAGVDIKPRQMVAGAEKMLHSHQLSIVEGVGGISAPLTEDYLVKDFFKDLQLPVIIVVKAVLGNVNHAVLTATYAQMHGLKVLGFIVNSWDEQGSRCSGRKQSLLLRETNWLAYFRKIAGAFAQTAGRL